MTPIKCKVCGNAHWGTCHQPANRASEQKRAIRAKSQQPKKKAKGKR